MPVSTDDAEMDVVLSLLAKESSDSTCTEPMAIMTGQGFGEDVEIQKPEGAHPKRSRRVNRPAAPIEEKRRRGNFGDCHALIKMLVLLHCSLAMAWWTPFPRSMLKVAMMLKLLVVCLMRMKRKKKKKKFR
jgi:hypothetical protein